MVLAPKCGFNRGSKEKQRDWERLRERQRGREEEDLNVERATLEQELATLEADHSPAAKARSSSFVKEKDAVLIQLDEVKCKVGSE